jgi:hypothetical protein
LTLAFHVFAFIDIAVFPRGLTLSVGTTRLHLTAIAATITRRT